MNIITYEFTTTSPISNGEVFIRTKNYFKEKHDLKVYVGDIEEMVFNNSHNYRVVIIYLN